MLKETFLETAAHFTEDNNLAGELWTEIKRNYSGKERHYHNLNHLENLLAQLTEVKENIANWDVVVFSIYYHDIIYNPLKFDNEEKSAETAGERMKQISVPDGLIELCKSQILATKSHATSTDSDTNYFTDGDLSILGETWEKYSEYAKNVRKEYAVYPDLVYKPGRKKVLKHFLLMDRIFKTAFFHNRFDIQAKRNLQREMESL